MAIINTNISLNNLPHEIISQRILINGVDLLIGRLVCSLWKTLSENEQIWRCIAERQTIKKSITLSDQSFKAQVITNYIYYCEVVRLAIPGIAIPDVRIGNQIQWIEKTLVVSNLFWQACGVLETFANPQQLAASSFSKPTKEMILDVMRIYDTYGVSSEMLLTSLINKFSLLPDQFDEVAGCVSSFIKNPSGRLVWRVIGLYIWHASLENPSLDITPKFPCYVSGLIKNMQNEDFDQLIVYVQKEIHSTLYHVEVTADIKMKMDSLTEELIKCFNVVRMNDQIAPATEKV